ncbi:MAG: hypothetical protein ABR927_02070 [Bacteroidales bacterium]|jgi:hypothetical protein
MKFRKQSIKELLDNGSNFKSIIFIFIFVFQSVILFSQDEIPDSLIDERIKYIQNILNQGQPNANRWWYGWLAGYSAATIGQGAICLSSNDKGTRQDMALGAATTLLGAAGQLLSPMVPGYAPDQLMQIPEDTHEARLQKLNNAEELLKASALREKSGRSWQVHAISSAVNLTSGLITWLGFRRNVWAGVENFALNSVITEAQIWTQPTRAMKDYQNYCQRFKSGENPISLKSDLSWFVSVAPGGIKVKIVF